MKRCALNIERTFNYQHRKNLQQVLSMNISATLMKNSKLEKLFKVSIIKLMELALKLVLQYRFCSLTIEEGSQ